MRVKLSKRAIFDTQGKRIGAEVFLHSPERPDDGISSNKLTFIMIKSIAEYGVSRIDDGRKVFIRISLDSLLMKVFDLINPFSVVYKIYPPSISGSDIVVSKVSGIIKKLKSEGAEICIPKSIYDTMPELAELSDIVEINPEEMSIDTVSAIRSKRKKILVSNIDDRSQLEVSLKMADLVSGDAIEEPRLLKEIKLASFLRSTLLRLLTLLNTSENIKEYAKVIETDAGMSAKLLRFVNSAYFSIQSQIKSIEQAAAFFGLKQLRNFILVISINDYASAGDTKIWKRSLIRAKIMEGLAKKKYLHLSAEAYLAGLFSLIDELIEEDKVSFLQRVNVSNAVISAYTDKTSPLGILLGYAEVLEANSVKIMADEYDVELPVIDEISEKFSIPRDEVINIVKLSYIMADTIIHL